MTNYLAVQHKRRIGFALMYFFMHWVTVCMCTQNPKNVQYWLFRQVLKFFCSVKLWEPCSSTALTGQQAAYLLTWL